MSKSRKPDINVDTNIPISSKSLIGTSKPQEAFYYYIKQIDPTAINRDKVEGKEVDIHLPSLNIGIEYDGEYSHSGEKAKEREKKKNDTLKKVGLKLIRVKEVSGKSSRVHCSNIDGIQIFTYSKCNNYRYLDKVIIEVITTIFGTCPIIVDRKADNIKILELSHQVALEKSIATVYPDIAKQWHPTENGNLKPSMFSPGSVDEVWWQCDKYSDHKWKAAVYSRVAGNGCPICAGKIVLAGFNDLASQCPELAEEWHPTKNGGLKPSEVTSGSNKKVWWRCKLGHEYKAQINDRVRGNNCPVCSGKKVLVGYNDLENKCPDLAKEWHPTKNGDLKPSEFTSGSNKKVWWRCKLGHEWEASIDSRALNGKGCPYCAGQKILPGFNDLQTRCPELAQQWHPTKNGILRPLDVMPKSNKKVWWVCGRGHEWQAEIYSRAAGNGCPYCAGKKAWEGFNDLQTINPELARQWHPTKNGNLKPSEVTSGSNKKVWWICELGHEWEASIDSRALNGKGCPYCAGQKILPGFNDLQTRCPELAQQWHPTKNGNLKPSEVMSYTHKKVWWICEMGHEWDASVYSRVAGNGCPYCAGKRVLAGYNDLESQYPEIAEEWHPTRNNNLKPSDVMPGSDKIVWWRCKTNPNHEWQARVADRTLGKGCPICTGKKVLAGFNDLQTRNPEIAKQWHPTKNGDLTPSDVTPSSNKKAWWICEFGHEWQAMVYSRTMGTGCPYCASKKVLAGFNDLQTTNPELAKQWHPTKNGDLKPSEVTPSSNKKAWWICEFGHEWQATISDRTKGRGCPICMGKKVLSGFNDLASKNPEIAKEWHPTKNGDLTPSDVSPGSNKKIWWICEQGHEWQAGVYSRVAGSGCPECAKLNRKKNEKK